jgi:hypothetical protein
MSETKFTPGGYKVIEHHIEMKAGEKTILVPEYQIVTDWIHGQLKREAPVLGINLFTNAGGKPDKSIWLSKEDAYLFAAAPAMYKKLTHLTNILESLVNSLQLETLRPIIEDTENLLTAARGEEKQPTQ